MREFSQLLDALVYTRSRNAKLKLIGDYLKAHARSRPRLCAGGADRRARPAGGQAGRDPGARRGADRSGAAPHEPRLCRRHGRDGVAALAEAASEPRRHRRRHAAPLRRWSSGCATSAAPRRRAVLARDARPSRRQRPLRVAQARHRRAARSAFRRGSPRRRWPRPSGSTSMRSRRCGTASSRPIAELFAWAEGRGEQPTAARRAGVPPVHARPPARGPAGRRSTIMRPSGNGTASASSSSAPAARRGSTAAPATTSRAASRTSPRPSPRRRARRRAAGRGAARAPRAGGAAASFNALQQRLGRKIVSAKMLGDYPAFVRLYDILFDGAEDLRALPWTERRARLEAFVPRLDPERFDLSALIEADSFEALEEIRAGARDAAIEGVMLKRRDSPYVAGRTAGLWYKWKRDPLTADCVLMYAQRGSGKRSSYYSRLHVRLLDRGGRAAAGRQGLFRLHRRGAEMARPLRAQPHGASASARSARSRRPWCSKSRSIRSTRASATSPASRCASRASAGSAPTSRPPRRTRSRRCWRWRPETKNARPARAGRALFASLCEAIRIGGRLTAAVLAAAVDLDLELEPVAFVERRHAGALDRRDVDERIGLAVVALDEAEALHRVEELDRALAFSPVSWRCGPRSPPPPRRRVARGRARRLPSARPRS